MHNGCLLLLAFVAVFQPIASYPERGLVDGRQQRCDYRTSLRDPGLNFHGTYRFAKPVVEERRLNREDIRDYRRNEVREGSLRIASSADRRHAERDRDTLKTPLRNRINNDAVLRLETRAVRVSGYRDERTQEIEREHQARVQEAHQARTPNIRRENTRLSEDVLRNRKLDNRPFNERRVSVELGRDNRRYGDNVETRRVQENRDMHVTTGRVRNNVVNSLNDRRLARERVQKMETQRPESRNPLARNVERDVLDRRSRDRELRSSSTPSARVNRAYVKEDSSIVSRVETTSLDREDHRISTSRRLVDEQPQLRDISRSRLIAERRYSRDSTDRRELSSENRREAQSIQRAQSTESRRENRENESNRRLARAVRSVDDRVSRNDRSGSRIFERERSSENQRNVRDTQSMEMIRSQARSTETRHLKGSRSVDRVRALEGQSIRNIERESRIRTAENRKDIRNVEIDSREHRMTRERSQENRRDAHNLDSRSFNIERADQSRRDASSFRVSRSERTDESRQERRILESRPFTAERVEQFGRDARNVDSRRLRTERTDSNRRNIHDTKDQSRSLRRVIDYRRVSQNNERNARIQEKTLESRRKNESGTEDELAFSNRRSTRSLNRESRSMSLERSTENRLNERIVVRDARFERRSEDRRERVTENRKEIRTLNSRERRLDTRGINRVRIIDAPTQRTAERLSKRETLQNRHSYTLQRESRDKDTRRTPEIDDLAVRHIDTESRSSIRVALARKGESQSLFRNSEHQAENETSTMNWQYIFYTVQALYLCGVLIQFNKGSVGKKTRVSWWSTPQRLIKVD